MCGLLSLNMPEALIDISYISPMRWGAYLYANIAFKNEVFSCTDDEICTSTTTTGENELKLYGLTGGGTMEYHYGILLFILIFYLFLAIGSVRLRAFKMSH